LPDGAGAKGGKCLNPAQDAPFVNSGGPLRRPLTGLDGRVSAPSPSVSLPEGKPGGTPLPGPLPFLCLSLLFLKAAPVSAGDALDTVKARGELLYGADIRGGAPYVFQDPRDPNHLIGFEVELADAIARRLSVRARQVQGSWETLLELLGRGDFDLALNGIELTGDKKGVVRFSRPYYAAPELLTVRKGDAAAPRTFDQLASRRVGTLPGSLAERILQRAKADVRTYEGGGDEMYSDLKLGRVDAVLLDLPGVLYYGTVDPALEVVPESLGEVRYAMAFRPSDARLAEAVDGALGQLAADGSLRELYERWGLWNEQTAALVGDARAPRDAVAEAYEAWKSAVGKPPPFLVRVRERYPRILPLLLRGAWMTLGLSIAAMALAMAVGMTLAVARVYGPRPLSALATGYIEFVRGTPLLIQLTMIYFGLPELGVKLDPFVAGCLSLGLNYAACEAENYRAGLESIPAGQLEASRVLGLSGFQTLRYVVAPQAIRVSLPPMTNDFIALLKDSSLVSLVTLTELTKAYVNLAAATRDHLGLGVVVALLYFVLGLPFARLARRLEVRLGQHLRKASR